MPFAARSSKIRSVTTWMERVSVSKTGSFPPSTLHCLIQGSRSIVQGSRVTVVASYATSGGCDGGGNGVVVRVVFRVL